MRGFSYSGDPYIISPTDKPPGTPHALNDEFNLPTLNPGWTWVNQGASTATIVGKRLKLGPEYSGGVGASVRALVKTSPGGDFTVSCKMRLITPALDYSAAWITLSTNANKFLVIGPAGTAAPPAVLQWAHYTDPTTYSASNPIRNLVSPIGAIDTSWLYLRLRVLNSTSNIYVDESVDGDQWYQVYTETFAAWLVSVDKIGIAALNQTTLSTTTFGWYDWFRVNWTPDYV